MTFKLIIAGSRTYNNYATLSREVKTLLSNELANQEVEIVSGVAKGADYHAATFANNHKLILHEFPAKWTVGGKVDRSAGYKRNMDMANFADGLLAFWDGKSPGTRHMIETMRNQFKPVKIIHCD